MTRFHLLACNEGSACCEFLRFDYDAFSQLVYTELVNLFIHPLNSVIALNTSAKHTGLHASPRTSHYTPTHRLWAWLWLALWLAPCLSNAGNVAELLDPWHQFPAEINRINDAFDNLEIVESTWIEAPADDMTIDQILTLSPAELTENHGDTLNFGHSESSFWVGFKLRYEHPPSADSSKRTFLLELPFPTLQRAALYRADESGQFRATDIGYDMAMSARRIAHRHFVFPVTLHANQTELFFINVMRKGGSVQAPMNLWTQEAFLMRDGSQNYVQGIFYGILLAMVLYNAFLFVSLRARTYLYYIIYISFSGLAYLSLSGYGFLYLWPEHPGINTLMIPFFCTLGTLMGLVFFKSFSGIAEHHPRLNRYIIALITTGAVIATTIVTTHLLISLYIVLYVGVAGSSALLASFYAWRKGSRQSGYFLLAWTLFIVGVLCFLGVLMGWIPSNDFTRHSLQIGSASEVLLLSFALADQISNERKAKYKALEAQHQAVVKVQDMESQLMHHALHSRATGLPNRALLRRSLDEYFAHQYKSGIVGLFLISLDNFHEFNKTLGHSTGDAILKLVTQRLSALVSNFNNAICFEVTDSQTHTLANVQGVTFGFALKLSDRESALPQAEIVLQAFERPFEYQGMVLDVESTIGISMYPEHGEGTDTLLRNAHIALETAAVAGNRIAIYSPELDPYSAKRLTLIAELKAAIEQDSLQLYFQPQVDLKTRRVTGAEVLIRWIHSEHGFIPPDEFIPLAERTGVIQPLTYWICKNAFTALKRFKEAGFDLTLSINISARNLQDRMFQATVLQLAESANLSTAEIVLELTETAMMVNPEEALDMLNALARTGIKLSIDDFGTGYSSLSYLKRLPVYELKIDRTFVMEMAQNLDDQVIVDTTLQMAHNLGLIVVAEGIEDQETLNHLASKGCDYAQGYHIARPMPEKDFLEWITHYTQQLSDASDTSNAG